MMFLMRVLCTLAYFVPRVHGASDFGEKRVVRVKRLVDMINEEMIKYGNDPDEDWSYEICWPEKRIKAPHGAYGMVLKVNRYYHVVEPNPDGSGYRRPKVFDKTFALKIQPGQVAIEDLKRKTKDIGIHDNIIRFYTGFQVTTKDLNETDLEALETAFKSLTEEYSKKFRKRLKKNKCITFCLFEYAEEGDLGRAYRKTMTRPEHSEKNRFDWIYEVTKGVVHLHEKRYIHMDIKPGNMLRHGGKIKICDFDTLKKIPEGQSAASISTDAIGTPKYWTESIKEKLLLLKTQKDVPFTFQDDIGVLGMNIAVIFKTIVVKYIKNAKGRIISTQVVEPHELTELSKAQNEAYALYKYCTRTDIEPTAEELLEKIEKAQQNLGYLEPERRSGNGWDSTFGEIPLDIGYEGTPKKDMNDFLKLQSHIPATEKSSDDPEKPGENAAIAGGIQIDKHESADHLNLGRIETTSVPAKSELDTKDTGIGLKQSKINGSRMGTRRRNRNLTLPLGLSRKRMGKREINSNLAKPQTSDEVIQNTTNVNVSEKIREKNKCGPEPSESVAQELVKGERFCEGNFIRAGKPGLTSEYVEGSEGRIMGHDGKKYIIKWQRLSDGTAMIPAYVGRISYKNIDSAWT